MTSLPPPLLCSTWALSTPTHTSWVALTDVPHELPSAPFVPHKPWGVLSQAPVGGGPSWSSPLPPLCPEQSIQQVLNTFGAQPPGASSVDISICCDILGLCSPSVSEPSWRKFFELVRRTLCCCSVRGKVRCLCLTAGVFLAGGPGVGSASGSSVRQPRKSQQPRVPHWPCSCALAAHGGGGDQRSSPLAPCCPWGRGHIQGSQGLRRLESGLPGPPVASAGKAHRACTCLLLLPPSLCLRHASHLQRPPLSTVYILWTHSLSCP